MHNRRTVPLVFFAIALILGITAGISQRRSAQKGDGDFMTEWSDTLSRPFLIVLQTSLGHAQGFLGIFRANSSLRSENGALRDELQTMRQKLLAANEEASQAARLTELLKLKDVPPVNKISARILIRPSTPWGETCTLDVGKNQGVQTGAAVISSDGLVGQVFRVTPSTSQVILLRDHRNAVDCLTQRTRTAGICSGNAEELLQMDYIALDADVKVGDIVISSGQGGVFPKGIRVGTVVATRTDSARHFKMADVRPAVEFRSLEEAFVVVKK